MVKKSSKTGKTLSSLIAIMVILIFASGCEHKSPPPQSQSLDSIKAERYHGFHTVGNAKKSVAAEAKKSVLETSKSYLENAYLDLSLARRSDYQDSLLSFFDEATRERFKSDWPNMSLGEKGKDLTSIERKKIKVPFITIQYDKAKKPSLSTFQFIFDVTYKGKKKMKLNTYGWLVFERQGDDWKIFDYWVKQHMVEE